MEQRFIEPPKVRRVCRCCITERFSPGQLFRIHRWHSLRPICRPGEIQRILCNGHKRVHALKYQSVTVSSGMIAHLCGPFGKNQEFSLIFEAGQREQRRRPYDFCFVEGE